MLELRAGGHSTRAIAADRGLTPGAVWRLTTRAVRRLRRQLVKPNFTLKDARYQLVGKTLLVLPWPHRADTIAIRIDTVRGNLLPSRRSAVQVYSQFPDLPRIDFDPSVNLSDLEAILAAGKGIIGEIVRDRVIRRRIEMAYREVWPLHLLDVQPESGKP